MYVLFELYKACSQQVDESLAGGYDRIGSGVIVLPDQVGIDLAAVNDIFNEFGQPRLLAWPSDCVILAKAIVKVSTAHVAVVINRDR